MTDNQRIDPERLAALLDGRLGDAEAAVVRAQLAAADDDTLSAYADAVAVSAELGEAAAVVIPSEVEESKPGRSLDSLREEATPGVVSIESARQKSRRWRTPAFAAAAAAAAVAVFMFSPSTTADMSQPALYAAAIPAGATSAGSPVWGVTRGAADGVLDRARAVRVGALLVDIELAALRGDTSQAPVLALASLVEGIPTGVVVATMLRVGGADALAKRQAMQLVDRSLANTGAYLEAARIATAAGDATFFDRAPADALQGLGLDQLVALTRASPRDAAAIHTAVVDALKSLTQ